MGWEFRVRRYKLAFTEWINSKVLLYNQGSISNPVINHNGKNMKDIYMCMTESLCYTADINTTL